MGKATFDELVVEVKRMPFEEIREEQADFVELVYSTDKLSVLNKMMENYFGAVQKAAGKKPASKDVKIAAPYGGIRQDQTLYYVERDGAVECAMFWPWGSGTLVTVKIAQQTSRG